ncbi:hypothetical protein ACFL43_01870 [Thermodesulfobacteriota bacterium]
MPDNPFNYLNINNLNNSQNISDKNGSQADPLNTSLPPETTLEENQEIYRNPITGEETLTESTICSTSGDGRIIKRKIKTPYVSNNEVINPNEIGAYDNSGNPIPKEYLIKCADCPKLLDTRNEESNQINDEVWLCEGCNKTNEWRRKITLFSLTLIRLPYYS